MNCGVKSSHSRPSLTISALSSLYTTISPTKSSSGSSFGRKTLARLKRNPVLSVRLTSQSMVLKIGDISSIWSLLQLKQSVQCKLYLGNPRQYSMQQELA